MYRRQFISESLALICCVLFLIGLPNTGNAKTAQEIAKKAFRSTVLLVMEDANGQPLSLGSGFFVRDGEIASNLHVLEGAARGYVKLVGEKAKYDIEGITAVDPERDLVVLKIKIQAGRSQALLLGNSDAVQVGETVYAVGNPQGLEGTFSQGIVSSIREIGTDKLLQITAPVSPGSSGGPVLNGRGEVIGVSVATFEDGQNLNFAIPANYLKTLLTKAGSVRPLVTSRTSKTQLDMGRSTEGVLGGQLFWDRIGGYYSLSLRNQLRESVKNVMWAVYFYDKQNRLINCDLSIYKGTIPAGLSKRVRRTISVRLSRRVMSRVTRTKIAIIDFEIER